MVILALLAPAARLDEHEAPSKVATVTEKVEVPLVLIEVIVLDKSGRHVRGLARGSFTVSERGEEVPIATFDEIDLSPASRRTATDDADPTDHGAPEAGPSEPAPVPILEEEDKRRFVLLFDGYNNASALRLVQARRAAKKFIESEMRLGDEAAIYEISPFLVGLAPMTTNLATLESALDRVRYFPGESLGTDVIESSVYTGILGSRSRVTQDLMNASQFGARQAAAEQRQYFRSLEALGNILETIPGRKVIVLFSGGFPIAVPPEDAASLGFGRDFKRMIQQLQKSRATVYSLHIGPESGLPDSTEGTRLLTELDRLGFSSEFLDRMGLGSGPGGDTVVAGNHFQAVLANESGGRFFPGHDYGRSLEAVDDDTQHFYLIGYEPPDPDAGRQLYRSINVSVVPKKYRVATRKGRFTTPVRLDADKASVAPTSVARRSDPGEKPVEHELVCSAVYFPGSSGRTLVGLLLRLEGPVSPVEMDTGELNLDISTRVSARKEGMEVENRTHDFRATFEDLGVRFGLSRGLRLTEAAELPPGRYEFEVVLRLNGLGVEERWVSSLDVPGINAEGLAVSGLTLLGNEMSPPLVADIFTAAREEDAGGDWEDPFRMAGERRALGVAALRVHPSNPLTLFSRVHNPPLDPATGLPDRLSLEYILVPEEGVGEILPPMQLVYFKHGLQARSFDVVARLDLTGVDPGAYRLKVEATDVGNGSRASQERRLSVSGESNLLDLPD